MFTCRRNHHEKRLPHTAFTLVELLVVIGIIALLISILLPSLSKARETSNRLACQANMKQIVTALIMYTNDNRGVFPRPAAAVLYYDWIYWQPTRVQDDGRIVPYLGDHFIPKLFICPSDEVQLHTLGYPYSYTVNETVCRAGQVVGTAGQPGYNDGNQPTLNISQIVQSSTKILLIDESSQTIDDGCWAPQNYSASSTAPRNLLANRHDRRGEQITNANPNAGRGNAAFCDSHVDFIQRSMSVDPLYWDAPWNGDGVAP